MEKIIPVVNLSLETLIHECKVGNRPDEDLFLDFSYANREHIHEVFKYRKFNYDFTDYLTCYNDGEHIIGYIRPSYDDFLHHVCRFLGIPVNSKTKDNFDLTKKMLDRIERLKNVSTEEELYYEFPYLYDDLIQGRSFIRSVEKMPRNTEEEKKRYETQRHYYYSCALKQRLDRFVETQAELYTRFTLKREDFKKLIESKSYNGYIRKNFDLNKIAMYTVHNYLSICEATEDDEVISEYFALVEKYENSNYDKTVSLKTSEGIFLNWETLKVRINNIRKKLNNREATAEWELVPEGRDTFKVKGESSHNARVLGLTEEELENLRSAGERKRTFYEGTSYLVKVIGLLKYRGYIGYIYPNGEVLLDREYNMDTPRSAKGNAIYHMKAADFEELSKLDKTVLQKHPKVGRIIHSKYWEDKAKNITLEETDEKSKEDAKTLVKKLKEKRI